MWVPNAANGPTADDASSANEPTDHESGDEPTDGEPNDEPTDDADEPADDADGTTGRSPVEDRRVPPEIAENLRALLGTDDRLATFGAWTEAVAAAFGDWPPTVDDLCHDEAGRHRAEVETETGTETYRFVCVLDAVMLPFLTDSPAETVVVYSEGPETGETVVSRVSRRDIETDPEGAVLSFGAAPTDPDAEATPETTYGALCPYVHAFPDRNAYERWDERIDAPTTALPLADGFGLARALVRT